jgi:hypothetical protein
LKLISLILALGIIAFLIDSQLSNTLSSTDKDTPKAPSNAVELDQFSHDMDKLMLDSASQQKQHIEEAIAQ